MQLSPYLVFDGKCREAFGFYARCLEGTITTIMTYAEAPPGGPPPWSEDGIMHASITFEGQILMGSDGPTDGTPRSTHLAIGMTDTVRAEQVFNALSESGTVRMPLQKTFWAERFGMLTDKFGVPWMVSAGEPRVEGEG